jgi:hypothetical protein
VIKIISNLFLSSSSAFFGLFKGFIASNHFQTVKTYTICDKFSSDCENSTFGCSNNAVLGVKS